MTVKLGTDFVDRFVAFKKDLNKFPSEIKAVIKERWRINPIEVNTINISD